MRAADEAGNEHVAGIIVQVLRSVNLLHDTVFHNHDAVAHGHSLGLVVGNVDEGGAQFLVQLDDLGAHCGTQLCVQVGQRLVEQEYSRVTNHSTAQSNTLTLTTGQSLRLTIQQVLDVENASSLTHTLVDFVLRSFAQLQTERHVLVHGHVGIQSVVLEHHRDVAILRGNVVYQTVADVQLTFADLLQTSDHTQGGGFTAAGRTDQDDKLFIFDFQVEIGNGGHVAGVDLIDVTQADTCHWKNPPFNTLLTP